MTTLAKLVRIMPIAAGMVLAGCGNQHRYACTDEGARVLARAALVSAPIFERENELRSRLESPPETIDEFVAHNRISVSDTGEATRCARVLGPRLVSRGLEAYDRDAYSLRMGGGPEELRPDVATSLNGNAVRIIAIGLEVNWLGDVLPPFAKGDKNPYWTTGTPERLQARSVGILTLNLLVEAGDDCGGCTLSGTIAGLQQVARLGEGQFFMLAMMVR